MFGVLKLGKLGASMKRFNPRTLFAASEPGAWYDPSDLSTLFQDSAGTTPVTAVEQPVGRILDKSGRGNHATQATTTKRPIYSRRVNLFSATESPSSGSWAAVLANVAGLTVTPTTSFGQHYIYSAPALAVPGSAVVRFTARANGYTRIMLREGSATGNMVLFDLIAGTVVNTQVYTGSITASVDLPGWFDCTVNLTGKGYTAEVLAIVACNSGTTNWASAEFAGDGVSGVDVTRLQFVRATDAHLPYQWVNTDTDYDADPSKFPAYLSCDGVDDALQTGNIDFTSTDKMTVWAGVTVSSSSDQSGIYELGVNSTASNGLSMQCMASPFATLRGQAFGTSRGVVDASGFALNTAYRVCAQYDLSAALVNDEIRLRKNGVYVSTPTLESSGTGNFSSYPLTVMARGSMELYTGGRLYSLIVRGAQTPLSQIEATELYIKQKMRLP